MTGVRSPVVMAASDPEPVPARATPVPDRSPSATLQTLFRLAALVAVAPIGASAIRNGLAGWYPTWDAAHTAVRVNDVFSSHFPLLGMAAAPSFGGVAHYSFPGALELYLLALPVKLLGISWGLLIGMALINSAFGLAALWLIRRRVGYRAGLVGCVFFVSLLWSIGSQVMIDPTPIRIGIIPFFALLCAAWSVADGDTKALPVFALSANYLLLSQLKFALAVPAVVLFGLIMLWRFRSSLKVHEPARWESGRRRLSRRGACAVAITVVCWIPPFIQQITSAEGNITALSDAFFSTIASGDPSARHSPSFIGAVGTITSVVAVPRWWLRPTFMSPGFDVAGGGQSLLLRTTCLALLVMMMVATNRLARRRSDRTIRVALGLIVVSFGSWVVSGRLNPSQYGFIPDYFHSVWSLAAFTWMILVFGLTRSFRPNVLANWRGPAAAVTSVVVLIVSLLAIPHADLGASTDIAHVPIARMVQDEIAPVAASAQPVIVHSDSVTRRYLPDVYLALQEHGIPFRVDSTYYEQLYGTDRRYRPELANAKAIIALSSTDSLGDPYRLFASVHDGVTKPTDFSEVNRGMTAWAGSLGGTGWWDARTEPTDPTDRFIHRVEQSVSADDDPLADTRIIGPLANGAQGPLRYLAAETGIAADRIEAWAKYSLEMLTGHVVHLYWRPLDH